METEDVAFNNTCEWQVVEQRSEVLPDVGISVLSKAFIIETVDLGDLLALVVTSEDGDSVRVSDLEGDEESHSLNGVVSSVDVVSHEEIVVFGQLTSNSEKFFEIIELTVNITTDGDGSSDWLDIALVYENFLSFLTKCLDAILRKWFAFTERFNLIIKIVDVAEVYFGHFSLKFVLNNYNSSEWVK